MTTPMRRWAALLCLPLLLTLGDAARAVDARVIEASLPADSHTVGRMNLNDILESPVGPALMADLKDNYTAINWVMRAVFGFELKSVDSIWFGQDPSEEGVVLLQGSFATDRVRTRMQSMPDWSYLSYPGIVLAATFTDREGKEQMAAILDERLLAIGDRVAMQGMLAAREKRLLADQPVAPGIRRVADSPAALAVSMTGTEHLADDGSGFEMVTNAWLEMRFDRDVHIHAETLAADDQIAEGLLQILRGSLLVAERHPDVMGNLAYREAVSRAKTRREGDLVTVDTVLEGGQLKESQARLAPSDRLRERMARLREQRSNAS